MKKQTNKKQVLNIVLTVLTLIIEIPIAFTIGVFGSVPMMLLEILLFGGVIGGANLLVLQAMKSKSQPTPETNNKIEKDEAMDKTLLFIDEKLNDEKTDEKERKSLVELRAKLLEIKKPNNLNNEEDNSLLM